jgi:hypothetical protein
MVHSDSFGPRTIEIARGFQQVDQLRTSLDPGQVTFSIKQRRDQEQVQKISHSIAAAISQFEGKLVARPSQTGERIDTSATALAWTLGPLWAKFVANDRAPDSELAGPQQWSRLGGLRVDVRSPAGGRP